MKVHMPSKTEIAALIKEYNTARNERLALNREADKLEQREKSILDTLTLAKVQTGTYGSYAVVVSKKKVPRCTDWVGLHAYIRENNAFDMLHKRLTETAIMARVDEGEFVPGIVTDDKITYTFTVA